MFRFITFKKQDDGRFLKTDTIAGGKHGFSRILRGILEHNYPDGNLPEDVIVARIHWGVDRIKLLGSAHKISPNAVELAMRG